MGQSRIEHIYLVDDSDDEIFMARIFFERQKIGAVLTSFTGVEDLYGAVQSGSGFDPATTLIVIDLNLTVCKGTEGVAHIRKMDVGPEVLIGISTGSEDPADRLLALEAGADFFVGKPLNRDSLKAIAQSVPHLEVQEGEDGVFDLYRSAFA